MKTITPAALSYQVNFESSPVTSSISFICFSNLLTMAWWIKNCCLGSWINYNAEWYKSGRRSGLRLKFNWIFGNYRDFARSVPNLTVTAAATYWWKISIVSTAAQLVSFPGDSNNDPGCVCANGEYFFCQWFIVPLIKEPRSTFIPLPWGYIQK